MLLSTRWSASSRLRRGHRRRAGRGSPRCLSRTAFECIIDEPSSATGCVSDAARASASPATGFTPQPLTKTTSSASTRRSTSQAPEQMANSPAPPAPGRNGTRRRQHRRTGAGIADPIPSSQSPVHATRIQRWSEPHPGPQRRSTAAATTSNSELLVRDTRDAGTRPAAVRRPPGRTAAPAQEALSAASLHNRPHPGSHRSRRNSDHNRRCTPPQRSRPPAPSWTYTVTDSIR